MKSQSFPLNKKIGILGGGQLGRMFIENALRYDAQIYILDPAKDAPCAHITPHFYQGDFRDFDAVYNFGKQVDVLTIEIEHVNTEALRQLEQEGVEVIPNAQTIETIKDKGLQKQFYRDNNIPSADFVLLNENESLTNYADFLPAFQKTRKDGYDGKGVQFLQAEQDFIKAFTVPSLLEKAVDIEKEISVLVAMGKEGNLEVYPVVELVFDPVYNLVDYLIAPAQITEQQSQTAIDLAKKVAKNLQTPGLFAVEMFLTKTGEILVNETAPRAHNSGHHTIEASISSQFDQQLRILLGLPLGSTKSYRAAAMINIVGEEGYRGPVQYEGLETLSQIENAYVHFYGKTETKPGRKMGHVSIIGFDMDDVCSKILEIKKHVKAVNL